MKSFCFNFWVINNNFMNNRSRNALFISEFIGLLEVKAVETYVLLAHIKNASTNSVFLIAIALPVPVTFKRFELAVIFPSYSQTLMFLLFLFFNYNVFKMLKLNYVLPTSHKRLNLSMLERG